MNKIKIFCTLGPSSLTKNFLEFAELQKVDLVRLNMSHLNIINLKKNIKFIQKNSNLDICIDTEGAQIRTKISKKIFLKINQKIKIYPNKKFYLYPLNVFEKLKKNDRLELGFDGLIIKIIKKQKNFLEAKCIREGLLETNKGVHLINRKIKLNFLTSKDLVAIDISKKYKIKNYALSFTNSVNDIVKFNKLIPNAKKIFKVETAQALNNFSLLNKKGNEFLIDRGDLSKDISIEKIPQAQRLIFKKKLKKNKIYIATNLLESMIKMPYPTRAEANDIYNAIEMGAAGLVLAAETAIGKYPRECITFLKNIIKSYKQKIKKF
jgi:pyruvate kinase